MSTPERICALLLFVGCLAASRAQADQPITPTALPHVAPGSVGMDAQVLAHIDEVMHDAIAARETPGGVVLVARRGSIVFEKAYGRRALEPHRERASVDTIYDLASLTKVVATAPAVLRLVEQGRLRLADKVGVYLPDWPQPVAHGSVKASLPVATSPSPDGKSSPAQPPPTPGPDSITLHHLLTHTSGLDDPSTGFFAHLGMDPALGLERSSVRRQLIQAIAARPLQSAPGSAFFYSDLNFLLLGEIVERVSGQHLDDFVAAEIFDPLAMHDTRFRPPRAWTPRIAPTIWTGLQLFKSPRRHARRMLRAEASLQNVEMLAGVAGHAGLFSTASDLAIFCQMILDGGQRAGRRILAPLSVAAMTRDQAQLASAEQRGFGWDIRSQWSTPRGDLFAGGFGHTGWSGGSLWLVPEEQLFIIVLTNRIHPRGRGSSSPLRGKIANVVAASLQAVGSSPQPAIPTDPGSAPNPGPVRQLSTGQTAAESPAPATASADGAGHGSLNGSGHGSGHGSLNGSGHGLGP